MGQTTFIGLVGQYHTAALQVRVYAALQGRHFALDDILDLKSRNYHNTD